VALEQIDSFNTDDENERLFLKVSYHRPHSPYDPPERLFEKHMALSHEEKYGRVIQNDSWDREWINTTRMSRAAYNGDPGDVKARQSRAVYYANVEFVDEGVGQILDALQAKNLLDDTFVAWVTDHGDMNGDHNLWRKGYPYEGAAHVRMLMKLPGQTEGKVSNAIVELRDVAPTLYDLLGTLQGIQARDPLINGQSLMPILQGEATKVREVLDLEHSKVYDDRMHWNALIGYDGNHELYKYIYFARGKEQLFCLSNDPNEHNDLSEDIAKVEYWRRLLVKQFQDEERGEEWVVSNGNLVANRAPIQFGPNFPCTTPTIPDALENNFARDDYRDTLNGVILQSIQLIICLYVLIS
jgi:arylsulfatase